MRSSVCSLSVIILLVRVSIGIRIPGENVDKNTLTTLGIKTLDWQGADANSSYSQLQVHHNYSKVVVQNEKVGNISQRYDDQNQQTFGQTAVNEDDYLELKSQDNQFPVQSSSNHLDAANQAQLNSYLQSHFGSQQTNSFPPQASFGGQQQDGLDLDDFSQFSDNDDAAFQLEVSSQLNQGQNKDSLVHQTTFEGQQVDNVLDQQEDDFFSTSSSSNRPIYNAHSYGNSQRLDQIIASEKALNSQQQFEDNSELDQYAEATTNLEQRERQVRKFYTVDKPIYVHGFKYPPDPEDAHALNNDAAKPPLEVHTKCPKMATGQFVYALSCNQFLNCWKGRGYVQNCAPGTLFNPQTLECDFASKVKCITGPRKPEFEQSQGTESQKLETGCPAGFSGVVPHHSDCSKFINCANGVEHVMDCPPGTLFSLKINNCDFPYKTECASWSEHFGDINNVEVYSSHVVKHENLNFEGNLNHAATNQNYHGKDNFNQAGQSRYYQNGNNKYASSSDYRQHQESGSTSSGYSDEQNLNGQYQGSQQNSFGSGHYGSQLQQNHNLNYQHGNQGSNQHVQVAEGFGQHQQSPYHTASSNNYGQTQNSHTSGNVHGINQGIDQNQDLMGSQSQYLYGNHKQTQGNYNNQNQHVATTYEPTSIGNQGSVNCPGGITGLLPHPYDCSKFLNCAHGQASVQDCKSGTVFNPDSKVCDFPYRVNCRSVQPPKNPGSDLRQHGQGSASYNQYDQKQHAASSSGVTKNIQKTQNSQYGAFGEGQNLYEEAQDLAGSQTQYLHGKHQGQTQIQDYNIQTGKQGSAKCPDGAAGLLPHPYDCSKFLNCANGQTFVQDCGPGTVFNPDSKICDFPHKVNCYNFKSSANLETTPPLYQKVALVKCPEQANGLHPHPTICSKFLNCANGQTFIQDCGPGTVFNPVSKVCDFPYNVECGATFGEGLQDARMSPMTPTISSGNQHNNNQQGHYDESQNADYGSTSPTQQGFYGQGQNTGWSSTNEHQQNKNTGQTQQEFYGQGQATDRNTNSPTQQGHNIHATSNNQEGFYVQNHQHGSSGQHQNSSYGSNLENQHQQGFYVPTQNGGASSFNKNREFHDQQGQNVNNNQQSYYGQAQTNNGDQQGLYGQTQNGESSSINKNQGFQGQQGQNVIKNQQGYYEQGQTNNEDQQFDETRNFNQQFYGTGSKQQFGDQNQLEPSHSFGDSKPPHSPSPFPSTDINADYEFGNEDGSPKPGTFKPVTLKPKPKDDRKRKNFCEPLDFHCSVDDCLPQSMVCDGIKDCPNGADEQRCESYLQAFTLTPNSILAVREKDKFLNISLVYCAKTCLESKGFQCKSFSYRKDDGACFLSDTNVGYSGALIISHPYNYYEVKSLSVNCTNMYKCPSQKCINYKQLCDGINDCGDRIDEKGCSAEAFGYQIKLGGTDKEHEGRIELKAFGKWGFICDDKFGLRDADVVCKELGFPLGALEVKGNSFYAQDVDETSVFYLMDDVTCLGNETTIRDCDFNGWGVHNCESQEVAGVICKTPQETCPKDYWKCDSVQECLPLAFVCDGVFDCTDQSDEGSQHCEAPTELRLAGGSSKYEGRVEVRHHGIWGTVCDDDFNDDAAKVVCKYLGFPGKATAKKDGYFGAGTGPIWLDQVFCQGNESAIQHCVHWNWGEHNCEHAEDVGVACSNTSDNLDVVGSERSIQINPRQKIDGILPEHLFPERCGFRNDDQFLEGGDVHFRVVKGSTARKGDYPWQASLRIKNKSKPAHWCGAVVISQKFVLTAAHCLVGFSKGAYFVVAGDYNTDDVEGTEQEAYIDEFYIHEKFRAGQKMNNDIAVIKLKGKGFIFTKDVQPICLPEADIKYGAGMNCTISGFGTIQSGVSAYSHQLRAGWIPIQSMAVCQMPHVYGKAITDGMICAGSLDEGIDACDGDSGGPLACLHDGFFTLYGLTSWGQHCGHANKPGVYVKVAHYRKWIDDTIRIHS